MFYIAMFFLCLGLYMYALFSVEIYIFYNWESLQSTLFCPIKSNEMIGKKEELSKIFITLGFPKITVIRERKRA